MPGDLNVKAASQVDNDIALRLRAADQHIAGRRWIDWIGPVGDGAAHLVVEEPRHIGELLGLLVGGGLGPDWRALIPARDDFYGEARNAFPVELAPAGRLAVCSITPIEGANTRATTTAKLSLDEGSIAA